MDFRILPLDVDQFRPLFGLDETKLARFGAQRILVDSFPGYPCRVSLRDADIGEHVFLMNYEHQSQPGPYRSSHAIFVREWASQAAPDRNEVPVMFRHRLLSVRSFDASGMMIDADVIAGTQLETLIERMLGCSSTNYLHIHNAKPGCFAATVKRAWRI